MSTMIFHLIALYLLPLIKTTICGECHCDPDIKSRPVPHSFENEHHGGLACDAGEHWNLETARCTPCPKGTFMTGAMSNGRVQNCLPCLQARQNEIVLKNCSASQDTEVGCETGHYRSRWSEGCPCDWGQCLRCHVCGLGYNLYRDHEVVPCSQLQNTKCCEERDSDVDCSPKTSPTLPLATTPRTLSTHVIPLEELGSQWQQRSENTFSKSSTKVCPLCLLILLSTVFKAALF